MRLALVFAVAQVEKRVFRVRKMIRRKNGVVPRENRDVPQKNIIFRGKSRFLAASVAFSAPLSAFPFSAFWLLAHFLLLAHLCAKR